MIKILESINDRQKEYEEYLETHISNVKKEYEIFKEHLLTESDLTVEELEMLDEQISNHDASKYEDDEFYPYLNHFYPTAGVEDNEEKYDMAWNHHQKSNPHHWQYWILQKDSGEQKILNMPENYVIEMLCDWSSFKYKNPKSTAYKWYNDNKDKMMLSDNTRKLVEKYIEFFK